MDDYSINTLIESKNEWSSRLVSILTFNIIQGVNSIYEESIKLCEKNNESNKYLMTFQNLLSKIPDWNSNTIETERKRIEQVSGCKYLEDLITCVHIIQLKALTCIRVGIKQQKIDIDIPSIDKFIHSIYINTARKLYNNIYLFEKDIFPLQKQKNSRELEVLVKECILNTIRENIPVEQILKVYMDETEEDETVTEKVENNIEPNSEQNINESLKETSGDISQKNKEQNQEQIEEQNKKQLTNEELIDKIAQNIENEKQNQKENEKENENLVINFSDMDKTVDTSGKIEDIFAPKDSESIKNKFLEKSSYNDNDDDHDEKLIIGDDVNLNLDTINLSSNSNNSNNSDSNNIQLDDSPILDIEEL